MPRSLCSMRPRLKRTRKRRIDAVLSWSFLRRWNHPAARVFAFFWPGWREEEEAHAALRKVAAADDVPAEEERAAQPMESRGENAPSEAANPADEESGVVVPLRRGKPTLSEVEALKKRDMSNRKIAKLYGVDESTIRRMVNAAAPAAEMAG